MRVIVTGSRYYNDEEKVNVTLDALHHMMRITCIIQGGATGADQLAREWAMRRKVKIDTFKADWRRYGNYAGPERNTDMAINGNADMCIAFIGGNGTDDMVKKAKAAGIRVTEVPA